MEPMLKEMEKEQKYVAYLRVSTKKQGYSGLGLEAKKQRGFKLGNPEHLMDKHEQAIRNSIRTIKGKAENNPNNKRAVAMLRTLTGKNATYQEMADFLNEQGFTTSKGCSFSKSTVYKLIKRYKL